MTVILGRDRDRRHRAVMLAVALVVFGLVALGYARPAHAVDFTVTNTNDSGAGSLRRAILSANANNNDPTLDTIKFNIPGNGAHTISPASALPPITERVAIDGYTQGDATTETTADDATENTLAVGDNAVIKIELNGSGAGAASGLTVQAGLSMIKGLAINRFSQHGVVITDSTVNTSSVTIAGNFLGTGVSGATDLGNGQHGVSIQGVSQNRVGGTDPAARNIISGNNEHGVVIFNTGATNNEVRGNYIGTDRNGTADLGNGTGPVGNGVLIQGGASQLLTNNDVRDNVISGNNGNGVYIQRAGTGGTGVYGNFIGTDATGTADLGNTFHGVQIETSNGNFVGDEVTGLRNVISGNDQRGVVISAGATNNRVVANYIGTDATGEQDLGNTLHGVSIEGGASGNFVGGQFAGEGNVISGNNNTGVLIQGSGTTDNEVEGNLIGTDKDGTADRGNTQSGVLIDGAPGNFVGGSSAGARNTISGNNLHGVFIRGSGATGNRILNNLIGTDESGAADLGNSQDGVRVESPDNFVGGTATGTRNVISGNNLHGVFINGTGATNNRVLGNYIGTKENGTEALANNFDGVRIDNAPGNIVGDTGGLRNVISGNNRHGVFITRAANNKLFVNLIGTDKDGTADLGNAQDGVRLENAATQTQVGLSGAGNVISGNNLHGVFINGSGSTDNTLQGNFIGTTQDGSGDVGNTFDGIRIADAPDNLVGGASSEANVISGNERHGAFISGATATGNRISRNSIFENSGLGINLLGGTENAAGATANDAQDPDTGPNNLQNKPVISSATTTGGQTTIVARLNSTPDTTFTIQFFSDPSGNEGKTFLRQRSVTTNANGNTGTFSVTLTNPVDVGDRITATATDPGGNTSEFSTPQVVAAS